ncbi:MAG: ergothioneine biosynthesis protein EgtB [Legionella sp.]|nr:MAG: ergothioneine biosynthesis protein EgtB [Legionella sp.]
MREKLIQGLQQVRSYSEKLCEPLTTEDYVIQGMEDVSPAKWHLAHTTWFFETFILTPYLTQTYKVFHPAFAYLFNSYYQEMGKPYPRPQRGLLSRPSVAMIYDYRKHVDAYLLELLSTVSEQKLKELHPLIVLGMEHEQQHQELLLMDIKYNFSLNPEFSVYAPVKSVTQSAEPLEFISNPGGLVTIGYQGDQFHFDNELPVHQTFLYPFAMASRLITNQEYLEFIADKGYNTPSLWLSDGWDWLNSQKIKAPLYWEEDHADTLVFTLHGLELLKPHEPVAHVSFYEADAFARWRGCRLATEAEWEYFVNLHQLTPNEGNFMESGFYHPQASTEDSLSQFFGDLWEWTVSPYLPYPGYKPLPGALGEYNGKFMNNQRVLKGGSCVTPKTHIRSSYRNFFQPDKRWQFSGIRLVQYY